MITTLKIFAWSLLLHAVLASPMQEYPDCISLYNDLGAIPLPSSASLPAAPSTTVLASGSPTEPSISTPSPGAFGVVDSGTGQATYYNPEVGLGSCGLQKLSTDMIAAAAVSLMQPASNPNLSPHCYQQVRLSKQGGTQTVTVAIMDTCQSCGHGNWDVTSAVFHALNCTLAGGLCPLTWELLSSYAPQPVL